MLYDTIFQADSSPSAMSNFSRSFLLLLFLGFLLRVIVMLWSFQFRENTDVLRYRDWGRISYLHGLSEAYKTDYLSFGTIPTNMPPGSLYSLQLMYDLNIQISKIILKITHAQEGSLPWMNGVLLNFFLRFPSMIADLIITSFIFKVIVGEKSNKSGLLASSLFLFNPVVLYNSAFWGQMDSINNLSFYICLYTLFKRKYFLSIFFYFLSLYFKLSLLPLLPVFFLLLYLIKQHHKLQLFLSTIISIIFILILTLPISSTPHTWFVQFFNRNTLPEMKNITAFSFNFWWLIFKPWISIGKPTDLFSFSEIRLINSPLDTAIFLKITLSAWGYFLFTALMTPFVYKICVLKQKIVSKSFLFLIFSNLTLLAYLFLPGMHERYLYPIFPLLITYFGLKQKYLSIFIALSVLNLINLYLVWHPMMLPFIPYLLMNNRFFQWIISLMTVSVGIFFYIKSIRTLYAHKKL